MTMSPFSSPAHFSLFFARCYFVCSWRLFSTGPPTKLVVKENTRTNSNLVMFEQRCKVTSWMTAAQWGTPGFPMIEGLAV